MTRVVNQTQVGETSLLDDAHLVQPIPACRSGGGHRRCVGQGDAHAAHEELHGPAHRQRGSGDRPQRTVGMTDPGPPLIHLHRERPEHVPTIRLTGGAHGIGDEGHALHPGSTNRHAEHIGSDMHSVTDELDECAGIGEQPGHGAGIAVVDGGHRVEQVGDDISPGVHRLPGDASVGIGVSECRMHPVGRQGLHGPDPVLTLGGEGDRPEIALASLQQPGDGRITGVPKQLGVVGTPAVLGQERPLGVNPGKLPRSDEGPQPMDLIDEVVHAFGDGAGELGGGAIGTVVLDGCPDLLRVLVGEIRSCCTVAVRVDVSGDDGEVDLLGLWTDPILHRGDPTGVDVNGRGGKASVRPEYTL